MADVDKFTDEELRTKLMQFGFPVMPITGTTRKVMVKKLKLLMENQSKPKDRRSLATYSSEEESDNDTKPVKKDKTNRRATMAVVPPMQPPINNKVTVRKRNDVDKDEVKATREERRITTTRTSKIVEMAERDLDTNSDSEPEIIEQEEIIAAKKQTPSPRKYSPPQPQPQHDTDTLMSRNTSSYTSYSPSRYTTYSSPMSDPTDKLNQIRSRLSLGATTNAYENYSSSTTTGLDNEQTPFLSNFTKRLSQLSSSKADYEGKDVIKEHDTNGAGIYNRSYLNRPKPRDYTKEYATAVNANGTSKGNNISFILVVLVGLFFVILTALYLGMHNGSNSAEIDGLVKPFCAENKIDTHCIQRADLPGAIDIYNIIKPLLVQKAIAYYCSNTPSSGRFYMTDNDIIEHIKRKYKEQDAALILEDLNNFIILLMSNPYMDVSVLQAPADDDFNADQPITDLDVIRTNTHNHYKRAFAVLNPTLPLRCSIANKVAGVLKACALILSVAALLWLAKKGYIYYKFYEQRRKDEIVLMVERIIDMLQGNASDEGENFLIVNHVRDMILPIDNRKRMERTWIKAVAFINEHESRIRTEVQVVKGEPYEVWRWLGGLNTSASKNKSWQGQAFETHIGSVNSPPCSPTPCLKVRGMIDDGDRNLHTIREAVLVKCADQCRILHCAVDINSKCVYLKCADQNDAAIAYRNLHGWWYASHLVTVKYLRLERYMQRFPDSPVSGPFLKAHQPSKEWSK